jgi:hypothetical protein
MPGAHAGPPFSAVGAPRPGTLIARPPMPFFSLTRKPCQLAAFAAFTAGQSILARQYLSVSLSQPGVARAVAGSALYLAMIALVGLGLGAVLRNAAGRDRGAVRPAVRPAADRGLPAWQPGSLAADVTKFLPATAGQAVAAVQPDPILLSPGPGSPCSAALPRSWWPWPPRECAEAAPRPRTHEVDPGIHLAIGSAEAPERGPGAARGGAGWHRAGRSAPRRRGGVPAARWPGPAWRRSR